MKERLIDIDVRLLLLRYGRSRVIEALAKHGNEVPVDIENELKRLEAIRGNKSIKTKKATTSFLDSVELLCKANPHIAESLRVIGNGYANRTFLPSLRDVVRFLDQIDAGHRNVKSRPTAGPIVMQALVQRTPEQLRRIADSVRNSSDGDFAMLSKAIIGDSKRNLGQ